MLYHGDARDILPALPAGAADVLITDPPAGIGFMGAAWDGDKGGRAQWVAWLASVLGECYRILPPGACGLVWALPRTSHWTATACEDAGFTIVDRIAWVFGSGFPKHKHALKPAVEDWWLIQKPGAARRLNVDDCRVKGEPWTFTHGPKTGRTGGGIMGIPMERQGIAESHPAGRWPAHLVLSHSAACADGCAPDCPVRLMGEQSGERPTGAPTAGTHRLAHTYTANGGLWATKGRSLVGGGDTGTAARFFTNLPADDAPPFLYTAKASRRERNAGCEGLPERPVAEHEGRNPMMNGAHRIENGVVTGPKARSETARNHHPTVKPQALMRWLVRLIAPAGGVVLDPFAGSGSTGVAALAEGRRFVGIEREAAYVAIAEARLAHAGMQTMIPLLAEED